MKSKKNDYKELATLRANNAESILEHLIYMVKTIDKDQLNKTTAKRVDSLSKSLNKAMISLSKLNHKN